MNRNRKAKIVATVGPASTDAATLEAMFRAGADVFRLNFSHGTPDEHRARVALLRELEAEYRHPVGILMDLQGPKLRLGPFAHGPLELAKGQRLRLDLGSEPGTAERVPLPLAAAAHQLFLAAAGAGWGRLDDAAVVKVYEQAGGFKVSSPAK